MTFAVTNTFVNGTPADADEVNANFEDIENEFNNNTAPVGTVMSWLKDYTNTPALASGWVECNGQTLSDGDSVYNGQVIPDLNGDAQFLYGKTTSGDTKTEDFMPNHAHQLQIERRNPGVTGRGLDYDNAKTANMASDWDFGTANNSEGNGVVKNNTKGTALEGYSVVWIIRIK